MCKNSRPFDICPVYCNVFMFWQNVFPHMSKDIKMFFHPNNDNLSFKVCYRKDLYLYISDIGHSVNNLSQDIYYIISDHNGKVHRKSYYILCNSSKHIILYKIYMYINYVHLYSTVGNTDTTFFKPTWDFYLMRYHNLMWLCTSVKLSYYAVNHAKCRILIRMTYNLINLCNLSHNGEAIDFYVTKAAKYKIFAYNPFKKCANILYQKASSGNKWNIIRMLPTPPNSHNLNELTIISDFRPQNPQPLPIMAISLSPIGLLYNKICKSIHLACVSIHRANIDAIYTIRKMRCCQFYAILSKYAQFIGASLLQTWTQMKVQIQLKYLDRGGPKYRNSTSFVNRHCYYNNIV